MQWKVLVLSIGQLTCSSSFFISSCLFFIRPSMSSTLGRSGRPQLVLSSWISLANRGLRRNITSKGVFFCRLIIAGPDRPARLINILVPIILVLIDNLQNRVSWEVDKRLQIIVNFAKLCNIESHSYGSIQLCRANSCSWWRITMQNYKSYHFRSRTTICEWFLGFSGASRPLPKHAMHYKSEHTHTVFVHAYLVVPTFIKCRLIVPFVLSSWPLDWGWYAAVILCLIPNLLKKSSLIFCKRKQNTLIYGGAKDMVSVNTYPTPTLPRVGNR